MKRILAIIILAIGVTHDIPEAVAIDKAYWQEFRTRTYLYESWAHFWFSVWGYKSVTAPPPEEGGLTALYL